MTEPEQWAVELAGEVGAWMRVSDERLAALTIQRAFEERERELREALRDIANPLGKLRREAEADGYQLSGMAYSIANDLGFVQGIARQALATRQDAPVTENSDDH